MTTGIPPSYPPPVTATIAPGGTVAANQGTANTVVNAWPITVVPQDAFLNDGSTVGMARFVTGASNPARLAVGWQLYNGASWDWPRTPHVFKTALVTASGDTALWTPTSGKKFRLMGYALYLTEDAVAAAAAKLEVVLRDGTSPLGVGWSAFVPVAAGTTIGAGNMSGAVPLGNGALSALANNVLNVNLSFALTGGEVRAVAWGTEE